jgi:malonyl-CoA O-methyltransferase
LKDRFSRAAATYDQAAALAQETSRRLAGRLDYVKLTPARVADIGCATGDGIRELQRRFPDAMPCAMDFSLPMLHAVRRHTPLMDRILRKVPRLVNADARALPLANASLGVAWSNLMLHWLDDPLPAFRELHRVLETGGLLTFAALGPDTLKQLRDAAAHLGAPDTLRRFIDMHDLGDMLMSAGFADPVMDREDLTLTYRNPRAFLAEQRRLGVAQGLLGAVSWRDLRRVFNAWPPNEQGQYPVSFEIVYGLAWKAEPRQISDGRSIVKLHRK